MSRMYKENVKSLNPFVGCQHNCIYCKPSFQRLARMQKCLDCQSFTPHFHPERLMKMPSKTQGKEFIFFPSMGDPVFAKLDWLRKMLSFVDLWSDRMFLMQSKNPRATFHRSIYPDGKPLNLMLGTTIETNRTEFDTPSKYHHYSEISQAPDPRQRLDPYCSVVTVEPILDFDLDLMVQFIKSIQPEIIYIGYDNHYCKLPEPKLEKTIKLIDRLKPVAEVREKSLRSAWYEKKEDLE